MNLRRCFKGKYRKCNGNRLWYKSKGSFVVIKTGYHTILFEKTILSSGHLLAMLRRYRIKSIKFSIFISLIIIALPVFSAFAMTSGFDTEELSKQESEKIISNIAFKRLDSAPEKMPIKCFDVNESGQIAIGSEKSADKIVAIYSSTGDFLYALSFEADGSFGVEWNGDCLNVYLVRASVLAQVDSQGKVLGVFAVKDTAENNSYWNNTVHSATRNAGGTEYKIDNNLGPLNYIQSSYSRLVATSADGNSTVLYDVGNSKAISSAFWLVIVIIFVMLAIISIVKQFKKNRQNNAE